MKNHYKVIIVALKIKVNIYRKKMKQNFCFKIV